MLPSMLARKSGHIAIMGSLFGYAGWPENGSYGASKAAVINLAESLQARTGRHRGRVTIINPGFVDTPLNAAYDPKKKLYAMSKERCARKILERLWGKPYEIAFPPQVAGFLKTVRSLPRRVSFPLYPLVHQDDGSENKQSCGRFSRCSRTIVAGPMLRLYAAGREFARRGVSRRSWRLLQVGAWHAQSSSGRRPNGGGGGWSGEGDARRVSTPFCSRNWHRSCGASRRGWD